MKRRAQAVTVRVPASTSNLGSGFDTLGLALAIHNRITIRRLETAARKTKAGAGQVISDSPMVEEAKAAFFTRTKQSPFDIEVSVRGDVPIARGLGSSVTVRLGVVAGLDVLSGTKLSRQELLNVVAELEHHPDNAAPAIFGGFTVAGMVGEEVRYLQVPVSARIRFVALIPEFEVSTEAARKLVPHEFSKADTVHSLNRVGLLSAAFASERYETVRGLFDDRVHQPYRQKLIPQLFEVIAAGEKAGALGGWLSGSGSTIICLSERAGAERVGRAMRRILNPCQIQVLRADNHGFRLEGIRW